MWIPEVVNAPKTFLATLIRIAQSSLHPVSIHTVIALSLNPISLLYSRR